MLTGRDVAGVRGLGCSVGAQVNPGLGALCTRQVPAGLAHIIGTSNQSNNRHRLSNRAKSTEVRHRGGYFKERCLDCICVDNIWSLQFGNYRLLSRNYWIPESCPDVFLMPRKQLRGRYLTEFAIGLRN